MEAWSLSEPNRLLKVIINHAGDGNDDDDNDDHDHRAHGDCAGGGR